MCVKHVYLAGWKAAVARWLPLRSGRASSVCRVEDTRRWRKARRQPNDICFTCRCAELILWPPRNESQEGSSNVARWEYESFIAQSAEASGRDTRHDTPRAHRFCCRFGVCVSCRSPRSMILYYVGNEWASNTVAPYLLVFVFRF